MDSDGFSLIFITFLARLFLLFSSDLSRDLYGISERSGLEPSREDTAHRSGRLTLGGCGHMDVGVQGETRREVPQHPGHRFHVHSVLEGQGGIGVAQIVEPVSYTHLDVYKRQAISST